MDDLISRQAAIKAICEDGTWLERQGCTDISMAERKQRDADILSGLPSAHKPTDEWCTTCKEYNQEKKCCPKFNRVIRSALIDAQQWIPCSERLPEEGKEVLISSDSGIYIAELEILDGNVYWNETIEYRSVKRVSAWCPLPEPYKEERKEE